MFCYPIKLKKPAKPYKNAKPFHGEAEFRKLNYK